MEFKSNQNKSLDDFAMAALIGLLPDAYGKHYPHEIAIAAFDIAEFMLQESNKRKSESLTTQEIVDKFVQPSSHRKIVNETS